MPAREWILAVLLAVAGGLFVKGVAGFDGRVAWLVAAVLLGAWAWFVLAEVDDTE